MIKAFENLYVTRSPSGKLRAFVRATVVKYFDGPVTVPDYDDGFFCDLCGMEIA